MRTCQNNNTSLEAVTFGFSQLDFGLLKLKHSKEAFSSHTGKPNPSWFHSSETYWFIFYLSMWGRPLVWRNCLLGLETLLFLGISSPKHVL